MKKSPLSFFVGRPTEAQVLANYDDIVGRWILTEKVWDYPGGIAKIIALNSDEEMAFNVINPLWCDDDGNNEIAIFNSETVVLMPVEAERMMA